MKHKLQQINADIHGFLCLNRGNPGIPVQTGKNITAKTRGRREK